MEQINTNDVLQSPIGNLFKSCGATGDGTPLTPDFMNGLMMELMNALNKSCQTPIPFDMNNPDSYNQLWTAITRFGGSCGVPSWATGITKNIVIGSDCQFYLANPDGDPPNNNPVGAGTDEHWYGPFCSIGALQEQVIINCCGDSISEPPVPVNQPPIVDVSTSPDGGGVSNTMIGTSSDSDGSIVSERWEIVAVTNGSATIGNTGNLAATQTDSAIDTVVTYRYCATDDDGAESCADGDYTILGVGCPVKDLIIPVTDSYIDNADFNDYTSVPTGPGELDKCIGWSQFSEGTADYFHGSVGGQPSPNGVGKAGFYFPKNNNGEYYEYVGQNLSNAIPAGSFILASFYVGSSGYNGAGSSGDRTVELYGVASPVSMPIVNTGFGAPAAVGHISSFGLSEALLGSADVNVTGDDWEILTIEFTAPFDIKCLVFGGDTEDVDSKYLFIDRLLVSEKSNFTCP